jgi:hypothetical protein
MNQRLIAFPAAALLFSAVAFAQSDIYQVRYAANLNVGDSYVDFTNTGATVVAGVTSNLCANVYTFDPAEELIACCTCNVTPNGLESLSVLQSLVSNPLTPAIPSSVVIKIVATNDASCNAATASSFAHGLLAWGTTLHQNTSTTTPTYALSEAAFSQAALTAAEFAHITATCGFIESNGSGFGICRGCAPGGLGAAEAK